MSWRKDGGARPHQNAGMDVSWRIARIAGPVLVVLAPTEALNLPAFAGNPAPVVYLNGTLLLAGGVTILQAHASWAPDWRSLITLLGWALVVGGLYRMVLPAGPQAVESPASLALLAVLFLIGLVLSWQGYRRTGP